jgi:hypothetical protein
MIIALLAGLLISLLGGDAPPLSDLVRKHVTEEDRAERASAIAGEMDALLEKRSQDLSGAIQRLFEIDARHDATAEDYEAFHGEFEDGLQEVNAAGLDLLFQLRDEMRREEWDALFSELRDGEE